MNHEPTPGPDAKLDALLQNWRVDDPLPPGFNRAVWRRIAAHTGPERTSPYQALRAWIAGLFARPAWSIGYALILLSAGLATGYWQATAQTNRWDQRMASRYVQSVDPYFQASAQP
jgi:hypothetical protein